jgi:hypothetical protein
VRILSRFALVLFRGLRERQNKPHNPPPEMNKPDKRKQARLSGESFKRTPGSIKLKKFKQGTHSKTDKECAFLKRLQNFCTDTVTPQCPPVEQTLDTAGLVFAR